MKARTPKRSSIKPLTARSSARSSPSRRVAPASNAGSVRTGAATRAGTGSNTGAGTGSRRTVGTSFGNIAAMSSSRRTSRRLPVGAATLIGVAATGGATAAG